MAIFHSYVKVPEGSEPVIRWTARNREQSKDSLACSPCFATDVRLLAPENASRTPNTGPMLYYWGRVKNHLFVVRMVHQWVSTSLTKRRSTVELSQGCNCTSTYMFYLYITINITLHCIILHHMTKQNDIMTSWHNDVMTKWLTLHSTPLHYITLQTIKLHYITLREITLHYITYIHYITLHYITWHYTTVQYITFHYRHYSKLHCNALRHITYYRYMHSLAEPSQA